MSSFAAIDVGSNAIRLAIGKINGGGLVKTIKTAREPVRLGADVFSNGEISRENMDRMVGAFSQFRRLIDEMGAVRIKAVATSAVREASNKRLLLERLQQESGISLEIIDATEEGRLIHLAVAAAVDIEQKTALIMDIGGGSVEYILSHRGQVLGIESYKVGTVRTLLKQSGGLSSEASIRNTIYKFQKNLTKFIRLAPAPIDVLIGTGGNIVCLGELRVDLLGKKQKTHIKRPDMPHLIERLLDLGYEGRLKYLKMRPDRADVILPAAYTVQMLFDSVPGEIMKVPDVGLKDGVMFDLARSSLRPAGR